MKDKKYCISYRITVNYDAEVTGKTKVEAGRKLKEILPDAAITHIWEVKDDSARQN